MAAVAPAAAVMKAQIAAVAVAPVAAVWLPMTGGHFAEGCYAEKSRQFELSQKLGAAMAEERLRPEC